MECKTTAGVRHPDRAPEGPGTGLLDCNVQVEPAGKLPRLAGIPVAVLVGEASFMAPLDHGAVDFLTHAGVLLRLERTTASTAMDTL